MKFLSLIVKNALRNKRRSLLTITSLAMSLCLLGVLIAMYHAIYLTEAPANQARRMVTRHKVSIIFGMPVYYREKIAQVPGVQAVVATQWFQGEYKNERQDRRLFFPRFAADVDRLFDVFTSYSMPAEQKQEFIRDRLGCVVSDTLANRLNFKLGDKITIKGDIFPFEIDLTVRGIFASEENLEALYFNNKVIEEWLKSRGSNRSFAGTFTVLADSPDNVPRISKAIDELFANSETATRTESEQAFALSFLAFIGNVKLILLSICAAVTFTIVLVAANTMAMSIRERTREIGVMKTLGFTREMILGMVLGESALISLLGGAIGLLIAAGLCAGVRAAMGSMIFQLQNLGMEPSVLALLLGISIFVGVCSAVIPAWNAARMPILSALKFTD
ncbi:MAG: FtsX-like permease family protein [Acidobacteria bacterium]|nr:FtsX-like permease family protein [Acidobacteriota bacterium]